MTVTGDATKGGPLHVVADLRNVSDAKVPVTQIRVWLMLAQGPSLVFYTAPYAAAPKSLDGGQAMEIPFEASDLNAFKYVADLVIRDGMPMPPNLKAPAPKPVGTLAEVLPTGVVKLKAFVVVEEKVAEAAGAAEAGGDSKGKTDVIASATLSIKVAELAAGDWSHLNDAAKQAFFAELTADFHGDAVAGQNAHDRAVKVGKEITPQLLTLLDDKEVSSAGHMWLAATLVDLHDDRAIDALVKILEKGGAAAAVVAYHGPKIKNAKLTAAIERVAATTKDASLTAWAVRGLGINGEKTDAALLEAMATHSDAAGRAEAAEILAGHPVSQGAAAARKADRRSGRDGAAAGDSCGGATSQGPERDS